jgi:hypothetical protein
MPLPCRTFHPVITFSHSVGKRRIGCTKYEMDFLPVGLGERGGDAIALRFGEELTPQQQKVVVLDGGSEEFRYPGS